MARPRHYSPQLERFLVCVLYHEAQSKRITMTRLVNVVVANALAGSDGWTKALEAGHRLELRTTNNERLTG